MGWNIEHMHCLLDNRRTVLYFGLQGIGSLNRGLFTNSCPLWILFNFRMNNCSGEAFAGFIKLAIEKLGASALPKGKYAGRQLYNQGAVKDTRTDGGKKPLTRVDHHWRLTLAH